MEELCRKSIYTHRCHPLITSNILEFDLNFSMCYNLVKINILGNELYLENGLDSLPKYYMRMRLGRGKLLLEIISNAEAE